MIDLIFLLSAIAPGSPPEYVLARAAGATTIVVTWEEPKIPNGIIQVSDSMNWAVCFINVVHTLEAHARGENKSLFIS